MEDRRFQNWKYELMVNHSSEATGYEQLCNNSICCTLRYPFYEY